MAPLLEFTKATGDRVTWHTLTAGVGEVPDPFWPGLWEQQYPESAELNPFWRFAVNNGSGEALAVWRALAWDVTSAPTQAAIPRYDRDQTAHYLGLRPQVVPKIRWEYEVNFESSTFPEANRGFKPARSCVPIRPAPTAWEQDNKDLAGLISVSSLGELHRLDAGVSFDQASEFSLFGVPLTFSELRQALDAPIRPALADVLGESGVIAHLTIVRDNFPGFWSHLAIGSVVDMTEKVRGLADHYNKRWKEYIEIVPSLRSFEDFATAMTSLTSPASDKDTPLAPPDAATD